MELSNFKHLQRYMTSFEIYYRKFERLPQIQQLSTTFNPTIEEVFETLDTADIDMSSSHSMIKPIVNHNFGNKFQHHNGPNQRQHPYKNTSQNYQRRYFQIPRTPQITYLKEVCI